MSKSAKTRGPGKYQLKTMLFGLKGAPAKFKEMMSNLPADVVDNASPYLDDVAIFGQTWEEHLVYIGKVLCKLRGAGIILKPEKCKFSIDRGQYLGQMPVFRSYGWGERGS